MDQDTETETRTAELTGQSKARQNTDTGDTGGHRRTQEDRKHITWAKVVLCPS